MISGSAKVPTTAIRICRSSLTSRLSQALASLDGNRRMAICAARSAKVPPASAMSWRLITVFL